MNSQSKRFLGSGVFLLAGLLLVPAFAQDSPAEKAGKSNPGSIPAGGIPNTDAQIASEIEYYWSLMEKYPRDASLHVNLGNLFAMWGWNQQALQEFRTAIDLNPRDSIAWTNLGTLHRAMGKDSKAIGAFRKAIQFNPNAALAYYNLGTLYQHRGKYDKSIENYQRAIQLNPSLASVEKNPQVVHNQTIPVVLLKQFQDQSERLSLPLQWIPRPRPKE